MTGRSAPLRACRVLLGALAVAAGCFTGTANAQFVDHAQQPIPNSTASADANIAPGGLPGCRDGVVGAGCRLLAEPSVDPVPATIGSPNAPEDDLAAALSDLQGATTGADADAAAARARAILVGDPVAGRAYSGIPLLNWNARTKVQTVPATPDTEVTIRVVRTPQHTLTDTWMLHFADPAAPYRIRYRISEVGGALGGELRPTPLLGDDAGPIGGLSSAVVSITPPSLGTGTLLTSRFTPAGGAPESGRAAIQDVVVEMPPARVTQALLEPGSGPGRSAALSLAPETPDRLAAIEAALGIDSATPTTAQRDAAIDLLAPSSPERLLWDDLAGLPAGDVAAAKVIGAQDAPLVDQMRSRSVLPAGIPVDSAADVTVVLENNETYVSRARIHSTGAPLRVQVINRDRFKRGVDVLAMSDRHEAYGKEDWGSFGWKPAATASLAAHQPPADLAQEGGNTTMTVDVPGTFALWVGDPDGGDQAGAVIDVESGPLRESLRLNPADNAMPVHASFTADGDMWIALGGIDELVRVRPAGAGSLAQSPMTTHLIPGGAHTPTSTALPLGPTDVAADELGLVWVTLPAGNAIARVDPAQAKDNTEDGIQKYDLPACTDAVCAKPFAPAPGEILTREPLQMDVSYDAQGVAQVWFTELAADRIGLMRFAPGGKKLSLTEFACGCTAPTGIALDADGDVWFAEGIDNRIGRLTPDPTDVASAGGASLRHYKIPSSIVLTDPELGAVNVPTSSPHSVTVDPRGMVWFTEQATAKVGRLDPSRVTPNTTNGIDEVALPATSHGATAVPADLTADRKGTIYWADEYGDAVGAIDVAGAPSTWKAREPWRPTARRSLTDSPILDPAGNLYFTESGANILTRINGVGAGQPLPAAPPRVSVDVARDKLTVDALREADSFDVAVQRGGKTVASATGVPVSGGTATLAPGAWSGDADALRGGDEVLLTPNGANPRAAIRIPVAQLSGALSAAGVDGTALVGGRPAPGSVTLIGAPGGGPIDLTTGAFTVPTAALGGARPTGVVLDTARPGVRIRTIAPVSAPADPSPATGTPGTGTGTVGTGASSPAPSTGTGASSPAPSTGVTGAAPATPAQPSAPTGAGAPAAGAAPATTTAPALPAGGLGSATSSGASSAAAPAACAKGRWLIQSGGRPAAWLLGRSSADVRRCLGAAASTRKLSGGRVVLRYKSSLELSLRSGKVERLTVTGPSWVSARGGLKVGASATTIRRALAGAARSGKAWRAVLAIGATRAADIRITLDRRGKRVMRIVATATTRKALDRSGRALLAKAQAR